MPIKLKNRGRAPLTLEVQALGTQVVSVVRVTAQGREESERAYPLSVFIPGRGESGELPDVVAQDPAVVAQLHPQGPLLIVRASASPPPSPAPASPDAPQEPAPIEAPNPGGVTPQEQ